MVCGSYRRGKQDVGDIDLVVLPHDFLIFGCAIERDFGIKWHQVKKSILLNGAQLEVLIASEKDWGAMIMYATGPGEFNIAMRVKAKRMGLKLNQYGVWNGEECMASRTEEEIFKVLRMQYLSPLARSAM